MAKIEIPGLEIRLGEPKLTATKDAATIPIEMEVRSWPKLLWYVFNTEYDVKWYQWPWVLYVIAKVILSNGRQLFKDAAANS